MQNDQGIAAKLKKFTVAIKEATTGKILGTGVIVTEDGLIMTCYHVVGSLKEKRIIDKKVNVYFPINNITKPAQTLEENCDYLIDVAIVKLQEPLPPDNKVANLSEIVHTGNAFWSLGFVKGFVTQTATLYGKIGNLTPRTDDLSSTIYLVPEDYDPAGKGMSGAPVLDTKTNTIIGIISDHLLTGNSLPGPSLAIPIQEIAKSSKTGSAIKKNVGLQSNHNTLEAYLKHVKDESQNELMGKAADSALPSYEYIKDRRVIRLKIGQGWNLSDEEILSKYRDKGEDAEEAVNKFIHDKDRTTLYIAGTFGLGKSMLVRKIALEYANKSLNDDEEYVPVIVLLKNGLNYDVYKEYSLKKLLANIIAAGNSSKNILLILDGLDEYSEGDLRELIQDKIGSELGTQYPFLKTMITTRLNPSIPEDLLIGKKEFLRLLPFTQQQAEEFFKIQHEKFFKIQQTTLTYDDAKNLGLDEAQITNPLLARILSAIFPSIRARLAELKSGRELTKNAYRAVIYSHFFHYLVKGKNYASSIKLAGGSNEPSSNLDDADRDLRKFYLPEKNLLRLAALLNQVYGENLPYTVLKDTARHMRIGLGLDPNIAQPDLQKMLTSFCQIQTNARDEKIVIFIHESFSEYIMAENYLIWLITGSKRELMNSRIPSQETLEFLDGLIQIIRSEHSSLDEFVSPSETRIITLFNSFNYHHPKAIARENMITNCINNIKDESIIHFPFDSIQDNKLPDSYASLNKYETLWLHRWISLFTLTRLLTKEYSTEIDKQKLARLITLTDHAIPWYLKNLSYADLSKTTLPAVKLARANLSFANLSESNLSGANLYKVNLHGATMNGTDLGGANLTSADLEEIVAEHAKFNGAILFRARLNKATLNHAIFTGALLNLAVMQDCKLGSASCNAATLFAANLRGADLQGTNFRSSNLVYADFTDAKNLRGENFDNGDCRHTFHPPKSLSS